MGNVSFKEFLKILNDNIPGACSFKYAGPILDEDALVTKREAARIAYSFVHEFLGEDDEKDWDNARFLRDIYDCHTCVRFIAQMYVKGIIRPISCDEFGIDEMISGEEARDIALRITDPKKREKAVASGGRTPDGVHAASGDRTPEGRFGMNCISHISSEEILRMIENKAGVLVVDLRENAKSAAQVRTNFPGAVHLSLKEIYQNPQVVHKFYSTAKDTLIALVCNMGYQSTLAYYLLVEAGYNPRKITIIIDKH